MFFKGRAGGRKFSKPEGKGAGTASLWGELLSPCRMQRLQHRSEEVKFISHKSHVKCLQGEVIKQMYEARGKVHPFQKTLPVSAALQKPGEAGRDPTSAAAAFLIVLFLSSPTYLIALSLLEQLAGLPPVRAARCGGCGLGERRVAHQTAREAWKDGVMDGGRPAINNQTKSFYWESCGKCGFGNICLHPTNNKWHFSPFLCFSLPLSSLPLTLLAFLVQIHQLKSFPPFTCSKQLLCWCDLCFAYLRLQWKNNDQIIKSTK